MKPIPRLPENSLVFDNSTIELLRCPREYFYSAERQRELVAERAGRNFGSTIHCGAAVRYTECRADAVSDEVVPKINEAMRKHLDANPQPEEDFRNFNHACTVMQAYNTHYGAEPFRILLNPVDQMPLVERSFLFPFGMVRTPNGEPRNLFYAGKIDAGIEDNSGCWSFDHKTTFMFGENWERQMAVDGGQVGYVWALRKTLPPEKKVLGYVINGIRIRKPRRKDNFTDEALVDASDFKREPAYVSEIDIADWMRDTVALVEDILWYQQRHYFPRHRWMCTRKYGPCDFYDVCSLSPDQRENALMSNLFSDREWSPLKKPQNNE
jgi:hypothetical protein